MSQLLLLNDHWIVLIYPVQNTYNVLLPHARQTVTSLWGPIMERILSDHLGLGDQEKFSVEYAVINVDDDRLQGHFLEILF